MILAGDERGRTQHGNNNAYCQDNEMSWVNWQTGDADLLEFTRQAHSPAPHASDVPASALAYRPFAVRRGRLSGRALAYVRWRAMADQDWGDGGMKSVMVFLNGCAIGDSDAR